MAYNNQTTATSLGKLIPEAQATEILKNVPKESAAMTLLRQTTLSTRTVRQNVLSSLPMAYWVSGDTGMKQTTQLDWDSKVFTVEELAAIVPIPINVLDDASFDFWGEVRPLVAEAIGRALDSAIFFGVNKPSSWPDGLVKQAVDANNYIDSPLTLAGTGSVDVVNAISDLMSKVEEDGFDPNGFVIPRSMRGMFRKLRDGDGNKLMDITRESYDGVPFKVAMDGLWPADPTTGNFSARILAGDWTKAILATRKDITYEIFREGVITDNAVPPVIIYNLMQQDMVAMRVTARFAFQTANPISYANSNASTRSPFAVLRKSNPA